MELVHEQHQDHREHDPECRDHIQPGAGGNSGFLFVGIRIVIIRIELCIIKTVIAVIPVGEIIIRVCLSCVKPQVRNHARGEVPDLFEAEVVKPGGAHGGPAEAAEPRADLHFILVRAGFAVCFHINPVPVGLGKGAGVGVGQAPVDDGEIRAVLVIGGTVADLVCADPAGQPVHALRLDFDNLHKAGVVRFIVDQLDADIAAARELAVDRKLGIPGP